MHKLNYILLLPVVVLSILVFAACNKDDDDALPITNDLRVLKVNVDGSAATSGVEDVSVIAEVELVFSHGLNAAALEAALNISPDVTFTISYDNAGSFATISFAAPLEYATSYTLSLPKGTYGDAGESSTEDFNFTFTTRPFTAPGIELVSAAPSFFEGETLTVTAELSFSILNDVTFDLVYGGSAELGVDYLSGTSNLIIPAGSTSVSFEITSSPDGETEGEETINISLANLVNAENQQADGLTISLGDQPPAIALQGVMSLKINGTETNGRAVHLRVLEDIADLSVYGLGIANNGGGSDGREIDFTNASLLAGDDILLVRDVDAAGLSAYFGECYNEFELVIETPDLNFNGDDPFELYQDMTVIETYGDVELDGTDLEWEYTGSWAYKFNGAWEYAQVDCSANSTSLQDAACAYPFCVPLQMYGVLAIVWDGSGSNGGKAVHVRAHRDIADLSAYGLGTTNNGGGTDGIEFTFPSVSVSAGDHILIAREPATLAAYFGSCYDAYAQVFQSDAMNQNGDDGIELFLGMDVIETFGDADVDGTGQSWEYTGSWAYRLNGVFTNADLDCAATSTTTMSSGCPYSFCQ